MSPVYARMQACWDCRNMDLGAFLHSPLMAELEALEKLRRPSVVSAVGSIASGPDGDAHEPAADSSWRHRGSDGGGHPLGSVGDSSVAAGSTAARGSSTMEEDPPTGADVGDDVADGMEGPGDAETAEMALHCPICLVRCITTTVRRGPA